MEKLLILIQLTESVTQIDQYKKIDPPHIYFLLLYSLNSFH